MAQSNHSVQSENDFQWEVLLATAIIWLMPVIIYSVYLQVSTTASGLIPALILIAITAGMPVVALVLYLGDKKRENGYISGWGYR